MTLTPLDILQLVIIQIFPVIGIGVQWVFVIYEGVGQIFIHIVDCLVIIGQLVGPSTAYFAMAANYILFLGDWQFVSLALLELVDKLAADLMQGSLHLIVVFPLVVGKHTRLVLEIQSHKQSVHNVKVESLPLLIELPIPVGEPGEFAWRCLEAEFIAILKNHMVDPLVDAIAAVEVDVDLRLQANMHSVAPPV